LCRIFLLEKTNQSIANRETWFASVIEDDGRLVTCLCGVVLHQAGEILRIGQVVDSHDFDHRPPQRELEKGAADPAEPGRACWPGTTIN
jgi:hypothetical protein